MSLSLRGKTIWVAGKNGMVGSALVRRLACEADVKVISTGREDVDLLNADATKEWVAKNSPDACIMAAAKVGGILANDSYPVDFLMQNIRMAANVVEACYSNDVEKLLFLGSSCIYPKFADQPIREDALLTGPLEATNEWYAISKIAGIKMCQAYMKQYGSRYVSAMPTNLYGPFDNFDLQSSHVLPALMRKFHEAKENNEPSVTMWGTGKPRREFMHVDDLADALVFLLQSYEDYEHINVGVGSDVEIRELGGLIAKVVGYEGEIVLDTTKPDGTPRKLMDSTRLQKLGWKSRISLEDGVQQTYEWYMENVLAAEPSSE